MKNLETLLQDFNTLTEQDKTYNYNDVCDFCMWLDTKGYRLNNSKPTTFYMDNRTIETLNANKFINSINIILTNPSDEIKFYIIQMMQDKGLTFSEMTWLMSNLQKDITELRNK